MEDTLGQVRIVVTTRQGGVGITWEDNTLTVDNAADFPTDGGQFTLEGSDTVYTYTEAIDGETEDDPDILVTVEPAPSPLPGDELGQFRINVWPEAVTSVAEVVLPDAIEDTVPCIIPHSLKSYLPDGIRESHEQEVVLVGQRDMSWVVVDIADQSEAFMVDVLADVETARTQAMEAHGLASSATQAAQDAHNAAVSAGDQAALAQQAAEGAQGTANNAWVSANGRNSRVTSLSAPGTGTINPATGLPWINGDTWFRWDTEAAKNVIGQWVYRDGAWVAELISSSVVASLDVNKLTVIGSARMNQLVLEKIIGDAAYFNVLKAGHIDANSFNGYDIVGARMTSGLFQTEAATARGVKISSALGFKAYNASGVTLVSIERGRVAMDHLDFNNGGYIRAGAATENGAGVELGWARGGDPVVSLWNNGGLFGSADRGLSYPDYNQVDLFCGVGGSRMAVEVGTAVILRAGANLYIRDAYNGVTTPESSRQTAKPLFLDSGGKVYQWANAPQRPIVVSSVFPSGTTWAAGQVRIWTASYSATSPSGDVRDVLVNFTNFPGGSANLNIRRGAFSATSCTVYVVNVGAATTLGGDLGVQASVLV